MSDEGSEILASSCAAGGILFAFRSNRKHIQQVFALKACRPFFCVLDSRIASAEWNKNKGCMGEMKWLGGICQLIPRRSACRLSGSKDSTLKFVEQCAVNSSMPLRRRTTDVWILLRILRASMIVMLGSSERRKRETFHTIPFFRLHLQKMTKYCVRSYLASCFPPLDARHY